MVSRKWLKGAKKRATARSTESDGREASSYFRRFDKYADDPEGFFREVLKIEPWEHGGEGFGPHGQGDILRAVRDHDTVACRSGHKTGKSTSAAGLALWFLCTRDEARVVCTAPTDRQVRKVVWREVKRLVKRSKLKLEVPKDPATGIVTEDGRELFGFTATDPDNFSGISGANVLYIADEASGIAEAIFEALEGNRAGGAKLYMPGNPTQVSGTFFNAFHKRVSGIKTLHIDSRDAARYGSGIPGLATKTWCDGRAKVWGTGTPAHDVRVAGNFPSESTNNVISLALVEMARARWDDAEYAGQLVIGVDVAREGDDETVIQPVRGYRTFLPTVINTADGYAVAEAVVQVARRLRDKSIDGPRQIRVNIDVIGIGASPFDIMTREYRDELSVCPVNAGHAAEDDDQFVNLRAELHFGLRDWFKDGGAIHDDEQLDADLLAAKYKFDKRGRFQVEEKAEIKKRLGRSPDRSDALMLAVYRAPFEVPKISTATTTSARWQRSPGRGFG
ncbi:MAG: hypothetical protein ACWGPR_08605 [Candidatus Deferrimicrobiaceae bacterium]